MWDLRQTVDVPWGWEEGPVEPGGPHFSIHVEEPDGPVAARVGLSEGKTLVVEVLTGDEDLRRKLERNLRMQLGKPRTPAMESLGPWNYAIHHCEAADNLYSDMVWVDHTG